MPTELDLIHDRISSDLDALSDLNGQRQFLEYRKKELIAETIPASIQAQLDDIDAEFATQTAAISEKISVLESQIRQQVLIYQINVKGKFLQISYSPGRTSWDTKALQSLMQTNSRKYAFLKEFQHTGDPFTTLKDIK